MTTLARSTLLTTLALLITASIAFAANFNGTNGDDTIIGTTAADNIRAHGGDDTVFGLRGDDRIKGGKGEDTIVADGRCPGGAESADYCDTSETRKDGDDVVSGGKGDDSLSGGGGDDVLKGEAGNDVIRGGGGDDRIKVRDGMRDGVQCGAGYDNVIADGKDDVAGDCESVKR